MAPMISIVGYADAGKTTLIEKLVPELKNRGYRVGTIKHAVHESNLDTQGKDSWRHFAAGADTVVVSSAEKIALIQKRETAPKDSQSELESLEGLCLETTTKSPSGRRIRRDRGRPRKARQSDNGFVPGAVGDGLNGDGVVQTPAEA